MLKSFLQLVGFGQKRLFSPLEDFHEPPALVFAERTGLHDAYQITFAGGILLVVRLERGRSIYKFAVDRMFHLSLNSNRDGFLHLVAGHSSDSFFAFVPFHRNYF